MCQYNAVLHSNHSKQISGTMTVQIGLKSMLSGTGRNKGMQTLWIHWLIIWDLNTFSSVQFISVAQSHPNLCNPMNRSMPGLPVHKQLPESTQTQVYWSVMPSSHLIFCRPLPPAPNPSQHQGLFQWVKSSHEVAKYWSFSFSISPSNEHPGLTSSRVDQLDLLAVQWTLESLLQHHGSKASIFRRSAFFTVQLSHPYRPLEKPKPWLDRPLLAK